MNTPGDFIRDGRVATLGLSPQDFERFLLESELVTQSDLAMHPERVSELMSKDEIWEDYEAKRELAWLAAQDIQIS